MILLPAGIDRYLTADQFAAVVAHEVCHVRRRDNLTAALHMAVEALFWFHPLVWLIGARLVATREQACDEHVLAETAAKLSPRTFWNFAGEFSSFKSARGGYGRAALISDTVLSVYSGDRAIRMSRAVASTRTGPRVLVVGCR